MPPLRVAVTGGIGAGKSEVLQAFARRGVPTLSADAVVHELIAHDPEVRGALEDRFATTDRAEIARIVFEDRGELAWLEALLHPRVVEARERWLAGLDAPVAVAEIPLLFETGGERDVERVIVVTAPEEVRRSRRPAVDARSDRLLPDDEKVSRADFVYVNDGTLEALDAFVGEVLEQLPGS
ncbi:MAG TPA: dephospho-CoA kinase [Gaiellaceae bacterium]|nr:dephospho-CoA kinase [Gaiellaceae bacterium]